MTFYRRLTNLLFRKFRDKRAVALMMVLAALATLAVMVGEITYTSQINQKLAYDRLDLIKAHSLAKSGLRLALLRIRAYTELKKTVSSLTGNSAAAKAAANNVVPKAILEKIWSEPLTIPFSGDVSSLPLGVRDSLIKFRKDSGMEGKLYIAIEAQSSKFNLNMVLPALAVSASPSPSPGASSSPPPGSSPTPTPDPGSGAAYTPASGQQALLDHVKQIFAKKFDDDEKFREQYRNFKVEDLVQEMIGWADITYESLRSQQATIPWKLAPYYDISELHYLNTMDDEVYDLLASQFNAGMTQGLNINNIKEPVLRGLVPQMKDQEIKDFFEFRDSPPPDDNSFKTGDDFFKYLSEKVEFFKGTKSAMDEFKNGLIQRGLQIITDETYFKIRVEATVMQTKRTMEALVSVIDSPSAPTSPTGSPAPNTSPTPNPSATPNTTGQPDKPERSTLKITQIRFF